MKNLELKAYHKTNFIPQQLEDNYYDTLFQTDTYFHITGGQRLKIRQEKSSVKDEHAYAILYDRPNTSEEKMSNYDFYEISECPQFFKVFGPALKQEIVVEKQRVLYLYKNARIHFDTVTDLGSFVEIEVVIKSKDDEDNAHNLMSYLIKILNIKDEDKISMGYRELLMTKNNTKKDLQYYVSENKVFWVVNKDIASAISNVSLFKANDIVPCIFVENSTSTLLQSGVEGGSISPSTTDSFSLRMLQLDTSIKFDNFKYTAWRKLLGQIHNIHVDVLLIKDDKLYDLNGNLFDFNTIEKSDKYVDASALAKFAVL